MFQLMVVEDDPSQRSLMETILTLAGYRVVLAKDPLEALDFLLHEKIDLIVLDVMMPKMDGYEFTAHMRSVGDQTPILMITAKSLPEELTKGFLSGADDYMVKPVHEEEMLLRIKALLRRSAIAHEHKLHLGKLTLDYEALSVVKDGVSQTLPKKEFYLLYLLLSYPEKIFTRLQLMDEIWGMDSETSEVTVNVHINRLRKRFEDFQEFTIVAIRGIGYKAVIHHG